MPRYFFDITDGHFDPDTEGTELPDIYAAPAEAIRASGEMLSDLGAKFWNGGEWKMEVRDEARRRLFTLRFSAEEHEA
jgi:hypothetical protein